MAIKEMLCNPQVRMLHGNCRKNAARLLRMIMRESALSKPHVQGGAFPDPLCLSLVERVTPSSYSISSVISTSVEPDNTFDTLAFSIRGNIQIDKSLKLDQLAILS
jgi:hypothetical protein